jgi:hypothetical protein
VPSTPQLTDKCIQFCMMRAKNDAVGINECEHSAPICVGRGRVRGNGLPPVAPMAAGRRTN